MIIYLLIGLTMIPIFFYLETKWPAPQWKHCYPHGKPVLSKLCWLAAALYVLLWPIYYFGVLPETIHTKNGNARGCNPLKDRLDDELQLKNENH